MNHCKHKVCIKVPKVYDWVQRQLKKLLISFDDLDDLFEKLCHDDYVTDVCRFLEKYPGFQVRCELIEDSLICQEIGQHPLRQDIDVSLPTGEITTLQKVKVVVSGLVRITILDAHGKILLVSDEIPFSTGPQTFFLCAPIGTTVQCKVTYLQCDAETICSDDTERLDISIFMCLDVQIENDVKLQVEAATCKPREELAISDAMCPALSFPPQCPEIFNGGR